MDRYESSWTLPEAKLIDIAPRVDIPLGYGEIIFGETSAISDREQGGQIDPAAGASRWAKSRTERACPNLTIAGARSSPDYFPYA